MRNDRDRHFEDFRDPKKIEEGGIIRISGDFILDHEEDILNLVKHEGRIAEKRNPLHRVTNIEKKDGMILVEISDHNLTLHIGKALHSAYKGAHSYKFLKEEKFVEVDWKRD